MAAFYTYLIENKRNLIIENKKIKIRDFLKSLIFRSLKLIEYFNHNNKNST